MHCFELNCLHESHSFQSAFCFKVHARFLALLERNALAVVCMAVPDLFSSVWYLFVLLGALILEVNNAMNNAMTDWPLCNLAGR